MNIIYDVETYPNCFTLSATIAELPFLNWQFEITPWQDDSRAICEWVWSMKSKGYRMVGFNNVSFDYPILHTLLMAGKLTAGSLYEKAIAIIDSHDSDRWRHQVRPSDRLIPQIDLFLIHHFDNVARATSLKELAFNMRCDYIDNLPFPVGTVLDREQLEVLKKYNRSDVHITCDFFHKSLSSIEFREKLQSMYGGLDWLNFNDTKIGKQFFRMQLENSGVTCYDYGQDGRKPKQTPRNPIVLKDAILPWVKFQSPEFTRVLEFLRGQEIHHTKGLFDNLTAIVDGFEFVFGLGGIHGSVNNLKFESDAEWVIRDVDVTSYYPMLAIKNGFYPEHLTPRFCEIYQTLFEERKKHKKKTPENEMLKLALNGVYGASNDVHSIFYDPLYTMKTTLNGQFLLCLLAEKVMPMGRLIQVNTDGLTILLRRSEEDQFNQELMTWENLTGLTLEQTEYRRMWVADVNNYLAEGVDGKVKGKGRYQYEGDWSRNHSALVVAKVAEKVLLTGGSIRETLRNWSDIMDFMIRVKIDRTSRLVDNYGNEYQRLTRYYVSEGGVNLFKLMPPLPGKGDTWRRFSIEAGRTVNVCNYIHHVGRPIDYDYYVNEVEKLVMVMQ